MGVRRRIPALLCTAIALCATVMATPARAQPLASPLDGSTTSSWRPVDPRPTNEELAAALVRLERRSHNRIEVRVIGETNESRPVWSARVGRGPVRILYVSQQHGDEPLGAPAALELLRTMGLRNSAWYRWLRSRVTLEVIVRANPDGHVRDWRYNFDPDADPEFGRRGQGYDINRYHSPALAPEDNPVPEAAHIQRAYLGFEPDIVVDYHMQGRYVDDNGREITASLFWPTHPDVARDAVDASKQVAVVAARAMTRHEGANVSQYPGGDFDGIARNAYGLRGSASVLVELSNMGAEYEQSQIRAAYVAMLAVVRAAATGSLDRVDPARAEAIPPRGEPIGDESRVHASVEPGGS